jgi:hypothetical protein
MSLEYWIKMRDKAAAAMGKFAEEANILMQLETADTRTALFWAHVHETAVRELACIPHPDENLGVPFTDIEEAVLHLEAWLQMFAGEGKGHIEKARNILVGLRGGAS